MPLRLSLYVTHRPFEDLAAAHVDDLDRADELATACTGQAGAVVDDVLDRLRLDTRVDGA